MYTLALARAVAISASRHDFQSRLFEVRDPHDDAGRFQLGCRKRGRERSDEKYNERDSTHAVLLLLLWMLAPEPCH
jgi:hypothetical protein